MNLLLTIYAAVITTVIWYRSGLKGTMCLGTLTLMYWGAALMWLVDAVVEYMEVGVEFFAPEPVDMLYDSYLGLSVIALGLIIWLIRLIINDPEGKIRAALKRE